MEERTCQNERANLLSELKLDFRLNSQLSGFSNHDHLRPLEFSSA